VPPENDGHNDDRRTGSFPFQDDTGSPCRMDIYPTNRPERISFPDP
jgi:hypothetical protein